MKKKIILIVLALFLTGSGLGLYHFTKAVLPKIAREKIISGLAGLTGGKVTVESVSFSLLRGIVLSGVALYEKDDPQKELCSVKEASASFLLLPFIKERQLIVPSLQFHSAAVTLTRHKDKTFNISSLIEKFQKGSKADPPVSFLVKAVRIDDATVSFTDLSEEPPVTMTLEISRLVVKMSWNRVNLETRAEVSKDGKRSGVDLAAVYHFGNRDLKANLRIKDVDLKLYLAYLKGLPISLETGHIQELKAGCSMDDEKVRIASTFLLDGLTLRKEGYSLSGAALAGNFSLQFPKDDFTKAAFQGKIDLEKGAVSASQPFLAEGRLDGSSLDFDGDTRTLKLTTSLDASGVRAAKEDLKIANGSALASLVFVLPLAEKDGRPLSYAGTVNVKNADVSGIPGVGSISNIVSSLKLKNADIAFESATARVFDTPVAARGKWIQNALTLDISGDFDLKTLLPALHPWVDLGTLDLSGAAILATRLVYDFSKQAAPLFTGEAALAELTIAAPDQKMRFTAPKGLLRFDTEKENLQWHFDAVKYLDKDYSFDGSLKGFKAPLIHAALAGPDIKVLAELTRQKDSFAISSLKGDYLKTAFDLTGTVDPDGALDLQGNVALDLENIGGLFPKSRQDLEKIGLKGPCQVTARVSGPTKNYKLWNVKATGKSRQVALYGFKFSNVNLEYNQIGQAGFINSLSFDAYGGRGLVKGRLDLLEKTVNYALQGILEDVDLNQLKLDTAMKDKTLYGTLAANIAAKGAAADPRSLVGNGAFIIKNGNLWEFNPLRGLGDFLFIPRFSNIVFTHAQGDFYIREGFITSDNVELLGPGLGLLAEGRMSFDGELDFLVNSQILRPGELGKVTDIVTRAGSLTAIKITGTVKEPKYKLQPIGENIMKKLGDIFSSIAP